MILKFLYGKFLFSYKMKTIEQVKNFLFIRILILNKSLLSIIINTKSFP